MNKLESKLKTLRNNFRKIFWVLPEKLREIRQAQEYQNTKTEKFNEHAHDNCNVNCQRYEAGAALKIYLSYSNNLNSTETLQIVKSGTKKGKKHWERTFWLQELYGLLIGLLIGRTR